MIVNMIPLSLTNNTFSIESHRYIGVVMNTKRFVYSMMWYRRDKAKNEQQFGTPLYLYTLPDSVHNMHNTLEQ